jgi:flagellar protein FliS
MEARDIAATHDRLLRAQQIVLELSTSLKADVAPELCGKLASLYNYVYRLLIDANVTKDLAKLDEALGLLRFQRETWLLALESLRHPAGSAPAGSVPAGRAAPSAPVPAAGPAKAPPMPAPKAPPAAAAPAAGKLAAGRILSVEG